MGAVDQRRFSFESMQDVTLTLRDGSRATARQIRPEDAERLRAGFERLSVDSRYRRFLSATPRLSDAQVRYLTRVDHHDHEALIAVADGEVGVGVARYARWPEDTAAADVAVTVADDWQGRGLGTALLGLLADRAREEGIPRFTALMLATNSRMLQLFKDLGPVRTLRMSEGTAEIELTLPQSGTGAHLAELLRGSADGRYHVRPRALSQQSGGAA